MDETSICPTCGASLPPDAPRGLCPSCLLAAALSGTTDRATLHDPAAQTGPASPATTVSLEDFRREAERWGLATTDQLEGAGAATGDVRQLARELVKRGALTSYQAGALLQGKARGLLVGDYLVLDKIGQGGMGVVFKARGRTGGPVVALKLLPPSFGRDRDAVLRFRREFEIASRLDHPNVVRAVEAADDRGALFLVMEFVDGYNLDDIVTTVGPLPIKLALHCAIQAARGLEAAHAAGVVHRDVKPGNLMLDASSNIRLLDLGLARVVEAVTPFGRGGNQDTSRTRPTALTQTGAFMGTVDFIAPEQADDSKKADHRADIYSLGCTLYFLLTGYPPFVEDSILKRLIAHHERPAPSLHAAREDVPAALEAAYQTMMAKRPGDRPRSMTEVAELLEACRTSAEESKDARAGLRRAFAETILKRAAPKKRGWGIDPSILARPGDRPGSSIDPNLRLEDVVTDYHAESRPEPLTEDQLPPIMPRLVHARARRSGAPYARIGLFCASLAVVAAVGILGRNWLAARRSKPLVEIARPVPPQAVKAVAAVPRKDLAALPETKPASEPGRRPLPKTFEPLFNGKDLTGWVPENTWPEQWEAHDVLLAVNDFQGRLVLKQA